MKRYICLIISLCLVLGSFSFVFATATSWDTSDQTNLSNAASRLYYNGYSAAYYLKLIADRAASLSTISSDLSTIKGYLFDNGHSIAYWTNAISTWMSPIYNSLTSIPTDLFTITGALGHTDSNNTYHPYLNELAPALTNFSVNGYTFSAATNAHTQLMSSGNWYSLNTFLQDGSMGTFGIQWGQGSPIGNLAVILQRMNANNNNFYYYLTHYLTYGYGDTQNAVNWGNLGTSSFSPSSTTDGIYKWFSAIQAPVARLSYVLASDERIAAQQAAALAEQQVVDDFIDPAGDSSATASDFGSISDLSSGYQQNFGSTASVSGIFNIFDSNNFGWFSSETYQQLDTTVAQRGSSFETPLLDQQLEDISRALGVDYAN